MLLPANEHKQLVVIDFEYASANTPGYEFANHFVSLDISRTCWRQLIIKQSEWCYNYLDPEYSYYFDINRYPTLNQQRHFISAYVGHRPSFTGTGDAQSGTSPFNTPQMRASSSNPPAFNLDNDETPTAEAETAVEDLHEAEVQFFMRQTRLWRVINSAQWVAWGVVQAKIPGMEEGIAQQTGQAAQAAQAAPGAEKLGEEAEEEDGFDYLAYAQDRAMIFWADMFALGLVREGELPDSVLEHIKGRMIEY